ncbi:DUF378 domain-containing protein [Candidatus Daviesbacteria bacterium]|nr:DUF378 domain-containing protein [Candidatus Daviesbacteria bacterium]
MKWLHLLAFSLVVIGALNWGLVGLFDFNLVNMLFGSMGGIENIVYILVGAAGIYSIYDHKENCMVCNGKGKN